jgi:hypothetical protein
MPGVLPARSVVDSFYLRRVSDQRHDFAPVLTGRLHSTNGGCRLDGFVSINPLVVAGLLLRLWVVIAIPVYVVSSDLPVLAKLGLIVLSIAVGAGLVALMARFHRRRGSTGVEEEVREVLLGSSKTPVGSFRLRSHDTR